MLLLVLASPWGNLGRPLYLLQPFVQSYPSNLQYVTLHYTALNYTTLRDTTEHYKTLHFTTLHQCLETTSKSCLAMMLFLWWGKSDNLRRYSNGWMKPWRKSLEIYMVWRIVTVMQKYYQYSQKSKMEFTYNDQNCRKKYINLSLDTNIYLFFSFRNSVMLSF